MSPIYSRSIFLLLFLSAVLAGYGQMPLTPASIESETNKIYTNLLKIRRDFYGNPELAGNEKRTREVIEKYLLSLGIELDKNNYGQSVVGVLRGKKPGKKIAWRADMDALPNDFLDTTAFRSKIKGIKHGCGHDVHLAIGLGIAEIFAKNRESINGTLYFIFQPEEETFVGAKHMIEQGLLSKMNLNEIYALHVTALPVGQILVKPDEMFAYQKRLRIELKNELSREEAIKLSKKIYSVLSRSVNDSKPWEIQSISDSTIGLRNPNTIFKDYRIVDYNFSVYTKEDKLLLETYVYETNKLNIRDIIPKVRALIEKEGFKNKLLSAFFTQENITVFNDKNLTKEAIKILDKTYGKSFVTIDYGQIPYFNDDFAYFQQKVPGVYFLLGGSNLKKGIVAMNHSPSFNVDEECIKIGVKAFSALILERFNER